jgi:hypothetical protein
MKTVQETTDEIMTELLDLHPDLTYVATFERRVNRILLSAGLQCDGSVRVG